MSCGKVRGGVGSRRLLGRSALSSLVLISAASVGACSETQGSLPHGSGASAGSATGGAGAAAGATGLAIGGAAGALNLGPGPSSACQVPETDAPVFGKRVVENDAPARRELFTWTTAEQAAELRAGSVLMTRSEREGLGPGYAMEVLAELGATMPSDPLLADAAALAALLSGPAFEKARYAWSEPWATRVGWPGEDYGDQLVRLVLRPEAWLARYRAGQMDVVDMDNAPVALSDALAHPERLAGVYFVKDGGAGGPNCGSFQGGSDGYREFIIGNEAMIEEWSLGTSEIRARLESDIALVQAFFARIRVCPQKYDAYSWNLSVVCSWSDDAPAAYSELGAYQAAVAIPSANYIPDLAPLLALLEALDASLFEPDPFVVEPGQ